MRLGFYYHIPAIEKDGGIYMPGYLGRFLDVLATHFDTITLFQHLPDAGANSKFDYQIQAGNIKLISLPPRGSVPNRILHAPRYAKVIKEQIPYLDAFFIRGPTPLLPSLARATRKKPTILMLVGDYLAGISSLPQPGWRRELIRLWSWLNYLGQLKAAKRSLVVVNSRALYQQYTGKSGKLFETRTSTLSADDLFTRDDTCENRPVHLLYTGRMDPAKGLLDMVHALSLLRGQGEDVVLDLVGWAEDGSDILARIDETAAIKDVKDRVFFHGYKAVGPELFAFYKTADIYLLASQSNEGFPRTIWEAMAHCVPVVATRVGSIPDFISGAAELVEPKDPTKFADGIRRVIHDKELRQGYVQRGFALAGQNTLESQVGAMAEKIKDWVEKNE